MALVTDITVKYKSAMRIDRITHPRFHAKPQSGEDGNTGEGEICQTV